MSTYRSFASAMNTTTKRSSHNRDCYCDNCCKKERERRGDWYNSASAKEQNQIMRGKK